MHTRLILAASVLILWPLTDSQAAANAAFCGQASPTGIVTVTVGSGTQVRPMRVFVPSRYDGRQAIPLVFDLHGSNGSGADQAINSDMQRVAEQHGFAVAWPDGGVALPSAPEAHYWNIYGLPLTGNRPLPKDAPDDVKFIGDAIDQMAAQYCIDLKRVYATGNSGGGRMSSLLACEMADRIAAVAPVIGLRAGMPDKADPSRPDPASCKPSRAVPVITFHGTDDRTNPYDGGGNDYWQYGIETAVQGWVALNGCSPTAKVEKISEHVERRLYERCRDGSAVEFNRIDAPGALGGGHTWPGSPRRREPPPGAAPSYPSTEINASDRIWAFFSRYHL